MLAASTEEASRLQVLQVGAQNHNATVCPAYWVKSIVPPPTAGAENCNAAGASGFGGEVVDEVERAVSPAVSPVELPAPAQAPSSVRELAAMSDVNLVRRRFISIDGTP